MNKPHADSFSEKISPEQRTQLMEWLADHTYAETCSLVAVPPPDGFGIEVSIATICRFYKAHLDQINAIRQERLHNVAVEQIHYADTIDDSYRECLSNGATLCLQERFYELLTRPVENVDQLKKLVYVCKQIEDLKIKLDPVEVTKDRALKQLTGHPLDHLLAQRRELAASTDVAQTSESAVSQVSKPAEFQEKEPPALEKPFGPP
jgi:hypothetical protein